MIEGLTARHARRVDAQLGGRARSVVLDQDVALPGEVEEELATIRRREVDAQAALVAVDGHVRGALVLGLDLHRAPLRVAARRLDLEDVGTEVGQHHRAVRPGEQLAEVEDADPGERQ